MNERAHAVLDMWAKNEIGLVLKWCELNGAGAQDDLTSAGGQCHWRACPRMVYRGGTRVDWRRGNSCVEE